MIHRRAILAAVCAAVVLVVGMQAAINLAVPGLAAGALHPSATGLLWIVDAYVIVFASLLIPGGALGDRFGRRGVLVAGMGVFAAGCAACALAPSVPVLLAGRAVTGVGAALALPNTLAVLVAVFPPQERAGAIATWAAMTGVGGVAGNVGAGVILQISSPSGMFAAFAVLGLGCAAAIAVVTPATPSHDQAQDPVGALLLVAGLVLLVGAIIEGPSHGWGSATVLGAFACSAAVLALFTLWELQREHPVLDPRVFLAREVRLPTAIVGLLFVGMFGLFFVNASYLQQAKGYGALTTGFAIAPMAVAIVLSARLSVRVAARLGDRATVTLGLLLTAAGLLGFATDDAGTGYPAYIASLLVLAAGFGLALPVLSTAILTALPARHAGLGSGLNGATRELGSALGVAIVGTILTARFAARTGTDAAPGAVLEHLHDPRTVAAFTDAMAAGIRVVAAAVLAGALLTALRLTGSKRHGLQSSEA